MTLPRDWGGAVLGGARVFICPLSHRKVSAIADGEGLPQYKLYYFLKSANRQMQKEPLPQKRSSFFQVLHGILGEEQLGGASADARRRGQGRFAACTFVAASLGLIETQELLRASPNPTRDAVP